MNNSQKTNHKQTRKFNKQETKRNPSGFGHYFLIIVYCFVIGICLLEIPAVSCAASFSKMFPSVDNLDSQTTQVIIVQPLIKNKIPQFEIRINSASSIDITKKGIDKAYAIGKIKELLQVTDDDIIFVGDALFDGGNDSPVKKTSVDYIQEDGPSQTIEFLEQYT